MKNLLFSLLAAVGLVCSAPSASIAQRCHSDIDRHVSAHMRYCMSRLSESYRQICYGTWSNDPTKIYSAISECQKYFHGESSREFIDVSSQLDTWNDRMDCFVMVGRRVTGPDDNAVCRANGNDPRSDPGNGYSPRRPSTGIFGVNSIECLAWAGHPLYLQAVAAVRLSRGSWEDYAHCRSDGQILGRIGGVLGADSFVSRSMIDCVCRNVYQ